MKRFATSFVLALATGAYASVSEIKVDLRLDNSDYVSGERVRAVVDIVNSSPGKIDTRPGRGDVFFIEVTRSGDGERLGKSGGNAFIAPFFLESGEGMKFETFLGDHYPLRETRRYLAKPVLVHDGTRFEGEVRAFDIVEGMRIAKAMQMFSDKPSLQRNFRLSYWSRKGTEHLFLSASDSGSSTRSFETRDLGPISRIDKPYVSILPGGEVVVFHRFDTDHFLRTEFWSLPDDLVFRSREIIDDPETAGTARVRELYRENKVAPKTNPWWKFW